MEIKISKWEITEVPPEVLLKTDKIFQDIIEQWRTGKGKIVVFFDEDGDILPTSMPELKSAAESIYESSNGKIIVNDDDFE